MSLVLVTGGTGFVGKALVQRLAAEGRPMRLLVRRQTLDACAPWRETYPNIEIAVGDLTDAASLQSGVRGVTEIFHLAADYRLWVRDPTSMYQANVGGTEALMRAAAREGVRRIVYMSSVATLKPLKEGAADETSALGEDEAIGPYKRSKWQAERIVSAMARDGLPVVIVNPSTPIGPGDTRPTPTGRIIVDAARGRIPAFVDTGLNLVHVDDVARGCLLALEHGRLGERYILGGDDVTLRALLAEIAALVGRPAPKISLPHWAVLPIAAGAELAAMWSGREPLATIDGVRMSRHRMFFSSAKARAELGYAARPHDEALRDAIAWFRAHEYID